MASAVADKPVVNTFLGAQHSPWERLDFFVTFCIKTKSKDANKKKQTQNNPNSSYEDFSRIQGKRSEKMNFHSQKHLKEKKSKRPTKEEQRAKIQT